MDDLSFDDLVPAAPTAAQGEQSEDLSFDDLLPKPGLMQRAASRGVREAVLGAEQTGAVVGNRDFKSAREVDSDDEAKLDPELDALLKKKIGEGYTDPDWWIAKLTHGATASSPMMGGALAGGYAGGLAAGPVGGLVGAATGGGLGAFVQTLGPSYVAGRKEGLDHGEAVDRAIKETMVSTAFGAAQGALPAVSFFGKAEGVLKKPISEALAQIFGAQPAAGVTQRIVNNAVTGQKAPTLEELGEDYVLNAVTGAVMTAGHQGYNAAKGKPAAKPKLEEAPPAGPDAAQEAAIAGTPIEPAQEAASATPPTAANPIDIRAKVKAARAAAKAPPAEAPPVAAEPAAPAPNRVEVVEASSLPPELQAVMDRLNKGAPAEEPAPAAPAMERAVEPVPQEVSDLVKSRISDDAGQTVPETADTLVEQQKKLVANEVPAQMFTPGEIELPLPKGMKRIETPKGIFHYNPKAKFNGKGLSGGKVAALAARGEENQILGLGDKSKSQVAADAQAEGGSIKAVVESTPEGTEVKAAAASEGDAPRIADQIKENASPGNTVEVKTPEQVVQQRQAAAPTEAPARSLSEVRNELPKDASGSPDYQALDAAIKQVTGDDRGWGKLTGAEQAKVLEQLKGGAKAPEPAPTAQPAPEPARSEVQPISDTHIQFGKARIEVQSDGIGYRGLNDESTIFYAKGKGPGTKRRGEAPIEQMAERGVPEPLRPIFDDYAHGRIDKATVVERLRELEAAHKAEQPAAAPAPTKGEQVKAVAKEREEKTNPSLDFQGLGGQAIADNMYAALWSKVSTGSVIEAGKPSPLLQGAKAVRAAGGLKTIEEFKVFAKEYAEARQGKSGPEFQAAMRGLVDKWTPKAPEPAPAPKVEQAKAVAAKRAPKPKMIDAEALPPEERTEPQRRAPTTVEDLKKAIEGVKSGEFHPHLRDVTVLRAWVSRLTDAQYKKLADWGLYNFPRVLTDTMEPGRLLSAFEQSLEKGEPVHIQGGDYSAVLDRAENGLLGKGTPKAEAAKDVAKARVEEPAQEPPKAEAPVTGESKSEAPQVLRDTEEQAALDKQAANDQRGFRGQDDGVAPDFKSNAARKRFLTRARRAVSEQGENAPAHYADAVAADDLRKAGGKGRSDDKTAQTKRVDAAWQGEYEAEQAGTPRQRVTGEAKGQVAKVEEKAAAEAKALEAAVLDPTKEDEPAYTPKSKLTDEQVAQVVEVMPPGAQKMMREINDPDKRREIAALFLDQARSQKSRGVFDGEQSTSRSEVREEFVQQGEDGVAEMPASLAQKSATMGVRGTSSRDMAMSGAEEHQTRAEVRTKDGGTKTVERVAADGDARRVSAEELAAVKARYAGGDPFAEAEARKKALLEGSVDRRSPDNHSLNFDPYEELLAIIHGQAEPSSGLSAKLNLMSETQFKSWLADTVATDKDGWRAANAAHARSPVKHLELDNFRRIVKELAVEPVKSERSITLKKALQEAREKAGESKVPLAEAVHSFLFNRIISLVGDMKVHILDDTAMNRAALDARSEGMYRGRTNDIVLRSSAINGSHDSYRLVLHEAVHGALSTLLNTNKVFRGRVEALRGFVAAHGLEHYGLTDVHEFISEAMSNARFQEMLSKVEITAKELRELGLRDNSLLNKVSDGFNALIDLVSQTFGLPKQTRTALEQAIRLTDEGLQRREALGSGAKFSKASADLLRKWDKRASELDPADLLAPLKNPKERFTNELIDKGVDKNMADLLAKAIMEELGDKPTMKEALPIIKELAKEFGTPKAGAKGKAAVEKSKARAGKAAPEEPPVPTEAPKEGVLNRIRDRLPEKVMGMRPRDMLETFRTAIADHQRPTERIKEGLQRTLGRVLGDSEDFYEGKRLLGARTAERIRQLETKELREAEQIVKDGKAAGLSYDDLGKGLVARATEERAARMKEKGAEEGKGSGMEIEEAQRRLSEIAADPKKQAVFDRVVELNDRLRRMQHDVAIEGGDMSKEQSARLYASEKKYTSLAGFEDEITKENVGGDQSLRNGRSASVMGAGTREAKGRASASNNPIENMFQQTARHIERAEQNRIGQALAKVVREGKPDSIRIAKNLAEAKIGRTREGMLDPRVVGFKENGEQRYIVFENREDAEAFARLSPPKALWAVDKMNSVMNTVKSAWTHYSPEFVVRHFVFRYPIEALTNLQGMREQGVKTKPLEYMKEIWTTVPDVTRYMRGEEVKNPETAKLLREMAENGGVVSYRSMSDNFKLSDRMSRLSLEKTGVLHNVKEFHEAWDRVLGAMDTAERLAVYKRSREAGLSPQKSAMAARDATVDFERKGSAQAYTGFWMEFGNVAVQTTGRFGKAFAQSPAFRRTILGIMAASAAIEFANYAIGDKDENGTPDIENIAGYIRGQNIVLLTGGKDASGKPAYVKLPLPYPLFMIWPTGSALAQSVMKEMGVGKMSYGEMGTRVLHGAAETLTPFGRNVASPGSLLTPAIVRPLEEIRANVDGLGHPIHTPYPKKGVPLSEQGKTNTAEGWSTLAKGLAQIGIDRYPEDVKLMVDHFVGAQRRLVNGIYETGKSVATGKTSGGEPVSLNDVPGVRVVMGSIDRDKAAQARFYSIANKAQVSSDTLKALRSTAPDAEDKALIADAVKQTGLTAKQLVTINDMAGKMKKPNASVKQADEEERPGAVRARAVIYRQHLKKLDAMGVRGEVH